MYCVHVVSLHTESTDSVIVWLRWLCLLVGCQGNADCRSRVNVVRSCKSGHEAAVVALMMIDWVVGICYLWLPWQQTC